MLVNGGSPEKADMIVVLGGDWKGKLSPVLYLVGISVSFWNPWIASGVYFLVALLWLIPDRRIERTLATDENGWQASPGPGIIANYNFDMIEAP